MENVEENQLESMIAKLNTLAERSNTQGLNGCFSLSYGYSCHK